MEHRKERERERAGVPLFSGFSREAEEEAAAVICGWSQHKHKAG